MSELSGTKELIFDTFIEMISSSGYENVSVRDITNKVGIKPASLYNHFENKVLILDYAYEYYSMHQYDNRKPINEIKKMIETASPGEIVSTFFYTFITEDRKKYVRMILITKIVYMRLFQDPAANTIFTENNRNNVEYVIDVLKHGIGIGRIDKDFDLKTFADILIGSMEIMGIRAFSDPGYVVGQIDQEKRILAMLARLLSTAMK